MGVDPGLRLGPEHVVEGAEALRHLVRKKGAAGIGHVDAVRAILLHQPGLARQRLGRIHVRHHQESGDIHAELARELDVLLRDVGLGAVGRDAHRPRARLVGLAQVVNRPDPGKQERGELRMLQGIGGGGDVVEVGFLREAVIERHAGQAVAVGDLHGIDPGLVERPAYRDDMIEPVLVADRMHAVAQRHVLDVYPALGVDGHDRSPAQPAASRRSMTRSPVRSAAEVMMSRLPA